MGMRFLEIPILFVILSALHDLNPAYGATSDQPGMEEKSGVSINEQSTLHLRCVQLGKRAENDILRT
jgi:hypothetical protein